MGRGSGIDYAARPAKRPEKATSGFVVLAGQKGQERVLLVYKDDRWQLPSKELSDGEDLLSSTQQELSGLLGNNTGQITRLRRSGPKDNFFLSKLRMTVPITADGCQGRWFSLSSLPELSDKEGDVIQEAVASIRG